MLDNRCIPSVNPFHSYTISPTGSFSEETYEFQTLFTGMAILEFGFQAQDPNKVWYLDSVSIIDTNQSNTEMLIDGDFESGSFQYWQMICSSENCGRMNNSLAQSTCHQGSYCYEGSCRNNYDYLQQSFHVISGHVYLLRFWIKTTGNPDPNGFIDIRPA